MLTQLLSRAAQTRPEKIAIVQGSRRISYQQLFGQTAAAGEGLRKLGIAAADCVAVVLPNCPEFIISLFACARLGAVMSPLNPQYTKDELQRFLVDGEAKVIITDPTRLTVCRLIISEIAWPILLIVVGEPMAEAICFDNLLKQTLPTELLELRNDPALYLYTSGSTSAYKRLCCTQENLYYEAHNFVETLGLTADEPILCAVPLYHSYGFGNGLLDAAYAGATLVLLESVLDENNRLVEVPFISRTRQILELIKQEGIRVFPGVPYQFKALADLPAEERVDLSGLKWCISSGDVLPKITYQRFLEHYGIAIRSLYGSTEAGSICINTDPSIGMAGYGSLGLPLQNVEIQIRDDNGCALPDDADGAIWVKSPVIPPQGYDNRPELNQKVFRHGYYDTGDVGKKTVNGHLVITGRKQTFVDVGGYKVDIGEIEEVLNGHPHILEAAALGVEMRHVGQVIKAVVVAQARCEAADILAYCRERLASYKLPALIEFREQLPRSPLGKVLKNELQPSEFASDFDLVALALPALTQLTQTQQVEFVAAQLQEQVAATLKLEVNHISPSASFQSLGFDSIRAAELQMRLIQLTGLPLSITLMWNHPSIEELAKILVEKLQSVITPNRLTVVVESRTNASPEAMRIYANMEQLLNWIDALSEADVDAFFQSNAQYESAEMDSEL